MRLRAQTFTIYRFSKTGELTVEKEKILLYLHPVRDESLGRKNAPAHSSHPARDASFGTTERGIPNGMPAFLLHVFYRERHS